MKKTSDSSDTQSINDMPTIKMYQDIVDRAHAEVDSVRKVYYWLSGIIGIILTVGIGSGTYLTYKSFHEMRTDMKEEVEFMKKKATQDYTMLASDMKSSVENRVQNIEKTVNTRIEAEFNKDNIQGLVKEKAQERIDKVADIYIGQHVTMKIAPKINAVDKTLKELEKNVEYNAVSSAAQNDDKNAFDILRKWAHDKSYPQREKAEQSLSTIISSKNTIYLTAGNSYPWKPGSDSSKWSATELRSQYRTDLLPGSRIELIEHFINAIGISKKEKLAFLNEVFITDKSLDVVLRSADLFNKLSDQHFDPFDTKLFVDWYEKHRHEIK